MARKTTRGRVKSNAIPEANETAVVTEAEAVNDDSQDGDDAVDDKAITTLSKRDLIDRAVQISGKKKKDAKPVVEAVLRELGDALSRGETLNLQPFGKGIVKSRKDLANAEVVELRLRRSKQAMESNKSADEHAANQSDAEVDQDAAAPLAEAAE